MPGASIPPPGRAAGAGPHLRALLRHGAWLEEGALIRDAGRLAGIPGVLIHGRLDLSGPLDTAWALARACPDAELVAIRDAGHQGSDAKRERMLSALDTFARQ